MANRSTDTAVQVRLLFDAKAAAWSSKYGPEGRLAGRLTQLSATLNNAVPGGGRVLDLGCGTGELARVAAAAGLQVTACDISPEMLGRAEASDPAATVDWVRLEPGWRVLPFTPSTFDAIVAASVFEYLVDPSIVLSECARMLRPGGVMFCTVPNLLHPIRWAECLLGIMARMPLVTPLMRHYGRMQNYSAYLCVSRQRHAAKWWRAEAACSGLQAIAGPKTTTWHSPLRLFSFQLANDDGD